MIPLPNTSEEENFFTPEQLALVDLTRVPKHVAIIPDGNRRWARTQHYLPEQGHRQGADILFDVVKAAKQLGIKTITMYTFSTENWNRAEGEVEALMWIIQSYLSEMCPKMIHEGVRLESIGDLSKLPSQVYQTLEETKSATEKCDKIDLVLALNYGGRDDICRAVKAIVADCAQHKLKKELIDESVISHYLDTAGWSDPELLIRTSGEFRLSNFLLWQISYAEVYVTDVLWPDFRPKHLLDAVLNYQKRDRRLGGT